MGKPIASIQILIPEGLADGRGLYEMVPVGSCWDASIAHPEVEGEADGR